MPKRRSTALHRSKSFDSLDSCFSMKRTVRGRTKIMHDGKANTSTTKNIQPIKLDNSVRFSSVGGLDDHIKCLREMVLFPLMYPNFFKRFNTRPPKGVLFHGPPGTGKTLLARALANECGSFIRGKKVAFFMRKGADVMNKFYGESEKLLKTLFQRAFKMRPSIIFFDEIDALAPNRTDVNSEAYTSIVATLLAEMDGLCDRGEVIIIGATNRPDAIDPALRRPGRLDRELYFPPPNVVTRREILNIYTKKWEPKPTDEILNHLSQITTGYLGSDLCALCTEAVLKALKRVYPQIYDGGYHKSQTIDTRNVVVTNEDLLAAKRVISPAGARCAPLAARSLPAHCEPLLKDQIEAATQVLQATFSKQSNRESISPSVFLICGDCAETHIAPALLTRLEHCAIKELSMATIYSSSLHSQEQAIISIFSECRRTERDCVIFIRDILSVWESLEKTQCTALLVQLWRSRAAGDGTLMFATSNVRYHELPEEVQVLFPLYKYCLYSIREPLRSEVIDFLKPVITELTVDDPKMDIKEAVSNTEQGSMTTIFTSGTPAAEADQEIDSSSSNSTSTTCAPTPVPTQEHLSTSSRKRRHLDIVQQKENRFSKKPKLVGWAINESGIILDDESSHNSLNSEMSDKKAITKEDVEKVFIENSESLRRVGLEALIDLYDQLDKVANSNLMFTERAREFCVIASRYIKMIKSSS